MARSSALYRTTNTRSKYKFPVLDINELVGLYRTMQFNLSENDILKPTQIFIHSLIEQIMDKFLYISPHFLRRKVTSGDMEIKQSLNIVICQRIMYKFLCDCGVDDFSIRDISKPDSSRLRIILSALVNYARFREQRMLDCVDLLDNNDDLLMEYKNLIQVNHQYQSQINEMNDQIELEGSNLNDVNEHNKQLESKLISLKNVQEDISNDHDSYRNEKSKHVKELENQSAIYIETEKELEQIRPYIKESPESIKELISKMNESKQREVEILQELEQKTKQLPVSEQSFQLLIQDFTNLNRLLDELFEDSNKHNGYNEKLKSIKSQISEKQEELNDLSRRITQLENQLKHNQDRLVKLQTFYDEKMLSFSKRIADQIQEMNELKSKRNTNEVEIVEKEVQISTWQRQIIELEKTWETECKDGTFMIDKLNSQVSVYLNEMEKRINEF